MQRGRVGRVRGRAAGERDPTPRDGAQKAEEASVVLQGADVRARETFPPAEIPERPREGAFGLDYTADPHPGEDLVPESQVQDEESGDWGERKRLFAQKGRCTVADQGWETMPVEADGACHVSGHGPGTYAALHTETLLVVRWTSFVENEWESSSWSIDLSMAGISGGSMEEWHETVEDVVGQWSDFGGQKMIG